MHYLEQTGVLGNANLINIKFFKFNADFLCLIASTNFVKT